MKKLYSIELLRVYFLIFIIIIHSATQNAFIPIFGNNILHSMGARVDIFMLICGFFLMNSYNNKDMSLKERIVYRIKRILPALLSYKILAFFILHNNKYLLSDLFILNKNIGIDIHSLSHVIWYIDVMFYVYLFYLTLLYITNKISFTFITSIISIISMVILFSHDNVNMHMQMANSFLDGGVLRCFAFMGMGILLYMIPKCKIKLNNMGKYMFTMFEFVLLAIAFAYPAMHRYVNKEMVLNYVLWMAIFIYCMRQEYGYLSKFLNKQSWIKNISKYCYEIYVFQVFAIMLGEKIMSVNSYPYMTTVVILVIAFIFGKSFKDYIYPNIKNITRLFITK